ncbi:MAG: UPF0149 family protein [Xanthomonadales bacterium]|nr:UPF0149 family protein [Xanthomonadales bacterium]
MLPPPPSHAEVVRSLSNLRLGIDASDLHGSLSGYLCAGGSAGVADWPQALQLDLAPDALAGAPVLQRLYSDCRAQFDGPCADVAPLLPADDAPLAQRATALAEWCRGFLGGCGLAGALTGSALSEDVSSILADFGMIAATRFDATEREDEQAFGDVLDFVRTAAALLHREVSGGARGSHSVH